MEDKDKYFKWFLWIVAGIMIVCIIFPIVVRSSLSTWGESGTFGDTFGALNAIFSGVTVAGLIITILMQRAELANQRTEMRHTRTEFSINRITNVIYNQLERYESALAHFKIQDEEKTYVGDDAIFFLDSVKQLRTRSTMLGNTEDEILHEKKETNCEAMKLYSFNHLPIAQFSLAAYNAVSVVKESLLSSALSPDEMNKLKNLFFRNIGFIQIHILEDILEKYLEYIELGKDERYLEECLIDTGKLSKAYVFMSSVLKFRKTVIDDQYIVEIKARWSKEFGTHA